MAHTGVGGELGAYIKHLLSLSSSVAPSSTTTIPITYALSHPAPLQTLSPILPPTLPTSAYVSNVNVKTSAEFKMVLQSLVPQLTEESRKFELHLRMSPVLLLESWDGLSYSDKIRRSISDTMGPSLSRQLSNITPPPPGSSAHLRWMQIPYGPSWNAQKIKKMIAQKDAWMNSNSNPFNDGEDRSNHRHVFFAGTMQQCLAKFCQDCNSVETMGDSDMEIHGSELYIEGPIRFITANPGHQLLTGSFRPIYFEDWASEAYKYQEVAPDDDFGFDDHSASEQN
ncbi:hypothetical protein CPB84DRAFT_1752433 [Gymnopilus junonius]|uniref:Uncharacterized protein n=1 Tax=Gymnopilus junonius TaxID=109634 RepID=A0A9P5THN8_GYMJU|nr:hypothetical protein CPB84DRAFT_1752433 [Gymnopilus junonius]